MKTFGGSRLLQSIIIITFLMTLSSGVTRALQPIYFVDLGATNIQLGLLMALPFTVSMLIRVPASALAYRLGRWRMMISSLALSVLAAVLIALVRNPVLLFPPVGISALTWAVFSPLALEYVSTMSTPTTRGSTMGLYFTSIAAALFVGPLIGSFFTLFFNLQQLFLVSTIFPIASFIFFLIFIKSSDMDVNNWGNIETTIPGERISGSLSSIFGNRNFVSICVARVAYAMSMAVFSTVYPVYAEKTLGFSLSLISFLFTIRGITNVFIRMPAGRLSDKIGRKKPFMFAYMIIILVYILLATFSRIEIVLVVIAFFGIGWGMRIAPSMAFVSESVKDKDRPLALSAFMTMYDLGSMLGSLLVGFTASFLTAPTLLLICVPFMIGGLTFFFLLSKEVKQPV